MNKDFKHTVKNLHFISKLSPTAKKQALSSLSCDECYYQTIKEIAKNIVNTNIKPNNIKKLKTHWNNIVEISGVNKVKKRTKQVKKDLVNQSGGWIWSIIPVILSLLDTLD
jgi:hypothetical protein